MVVTVPTLTAGASIVFSSSSTNILTLYGIQSEVISKDAGFIEMPMPTKDSKDKIMMDLMGASRQVKIEGKVTQEDTNLDDYINDLVGLKDSPTNGFTSLINGRQGNNGGQKGYIYKPWMINIARITDITITVYVTDVTVTAEAGNPRSVIYSISLMECSGTSSN